MIELSRKRIVQAGIGAAISIGALTYIFSKYAFSDVLSSMQNIQWYWLLIAVAIKFAILMIKNKRWQVELGAMNHNSFKRTFRALGLGYFCNILLPFKLGELVRVGVLKRHNPFVSRLDALATIAAERTLDGGVLALLVLSLSSFAQIPKWAMIGVYFLAIALAGISSISIYLGLKTKLGEASNHGAAFLKRILSGLIRGGAVLRSPRPLALAALLTLVAWVAEVLAFWSVVQSLGLPLAYADCAVASLILALGMLIPSAPGQLGTHQALTMFTLSKFGIAEINSLSLSVTLQATTIFHLTLVGIWLLLQEVGASTLVEEPLDERADLNSRRAG